MTYRELMKALSDGKKLRFKEWPEKMFIFMNEKNEIEDHKGVKVGVGSSSAVLRGGSWNNFSGSGVFFALLDFDPVGSYCGISFRYIKDWEIFNLKKKIKLYRYTHFDSYHSFYEQTDWIGASHEKTFDQNTFTLVKTEEKEIEVDSE